MQDFDFKIEHRTSDRMKHVDALSRFPMPNVMILDEDRNMFLSLQKAQQEDKNIQQMMQQVRQGTSTGYMLQDDVLKLLKMNHCC